MERTQVQFTADADWANAIASGDKQAFELLVTTYAPGIRRAIAQRVPFEHVEDVLSDFWLAALQSMGSYAGRSTLHTWLYTIALRRCCLFWRRTGYAARALMESCAMDESPVASGTKERYTDTREEMELRLTMRRCLAELSPQDAELFQLRYCADLSVEQIAEQLAWDESRVKIRLFRGRSRLKKAYLQLAAAERISV